MTDERRRCAVLGSPIAHSLSPVIHQAAYAQLGLPWTYGAHEVEEAGLAGFVGGLDASWRGLSLTMPLKQVALHVADEVDGLVAAIGVANTLVRVDDNGAGGRWRAANTDVGGAVAALTERGVAQPARACVWGAGATTASLLAALAELGADHAHVHARSPQRAAPVIDRAQRWRIAVELVPWTVDASCARADLTVSTVPGRAIDDLAEQLVGSSTAGRTVFDVVYDPWPTPLAARWLDAGGAVVSGLDLLVHQAVGQVALMTGSEVAPAILRRAAKAELATRAAARR